MTKCGLELTYNDDTWSSVVSPDQVGCNEYILKHIDSLNGKNILHVGIGNSSVYTAFGKSVARIDGITIMDSEIRVAESIIDASWCPYNIYKLNKYNKSNFSNFSKDYSMIIDNNLSHYACCQQHWEEYFYAIEDLLVDGGCILTHSQGFMPHTRNIGTLTLSELEKLSAGRLDVIQVADMMNNYNHSPVIIRKK